MRKLLKSAINASLTPSKVKAYTVSYVYLPVSGLYHVQFSSNMNCSYAEVKAWMQLAWHTAATLSDRDCRCLLVFPYHACELLECDRMKWISLCYQNFSQTGMGWHCSPVTQMHLRMHKDCDLYWLCIEYIFECTVIFVAYTQ